METENIQTPEIQNIPQPEVVSEVPEVTTPEPEFNPEQVEIEVRERKEEKIEYGDDIDPDEAKTIGTIVEKQTASVKKALQEAQDRLEVDTFIQDKPEFSKYKGAILKYLQHPVYSQIPVKNIATMVAANDLMKIGAEKERMAQQKASNTRTTGTPARTFQTGQSDWKAMNKSEFEAQKRRILGHQV